MHPLRLLSTLILASASPAQGQILFEDTFDRANNRNIDAALTGLTDNTGSTLSADNVYTQPWLDPNNRAPAFGAQDGDGANGGGSQILSNQLQLATGVGTSNAYVNHNFTNSEIVADGGFSVSLDVTGYTQTDFRFGGGFGVGMSQAEADTAADAFNLTPGRFTGAFHDNSTIGLAVPGVVLSDFWVALRGNNTLIWGGSSGSINGVTGLASKTGTIRVDFSCNDFDADSLVKYEIFLNDVSQGEGTFTWSGTNENFIGLDGRDSSGVSLDNFSVSTFTPPPGVIVNVTPGTVTADTAAQTVTLDWSAFGIPAGATYEITTDKLVTFPNGDSTGSFTGGVGSVEAIIDGTLGDTTFTFSVSDSSSAVITSDTAIVNQIPPERPNVIVMLVDDLGWGDLGCYGSEIPTPNIDALSSNGVRFRQFYNSARCSPTRCSLLTGLYPQQAAVNPANPLPDLRNDNNVTFAELLGSEGYRTYMAGKWHLGNGAYLPENRGFQHVWRMANGQANNTNQWDQGAYTMISAEIPLRDYAGNGEQFYQTDAIGDYALDYIDHNVGKNDDAPFAMFLAFGAPHFPIQAPAEEADAFAATYAQGWDVIRQNRYDNQLATGVIDSRYPYLPLGGVGPHQQEPIVAIPAWNTLASDRQADLVRRMSLYAAMIKKIDDNVGKVVAHLEETHQLDNTIILFMSDNGGNHERGVFGSYLGASDAGPLTGANLTNMGQPGANDQIHYGGGWAHVSNTPLKLFKHFTHEGGIRAPLIVHWPDGFSARDTWVETPAHLVDVMGTIVDASGATYPTEFAGHPVLPLEGTSLRPLLNGQSIADRPIFVEHESNRMIRKGKWKLVTESFTAFDNEFTTHQKLLFDMDLDPGESTDVAADNPAKVVELVDEWNAWSTRVGLPEGRLIVPPPDNLTPATTAADLFLDSFNRASGDDIDVSATGMSGTRVPPIGSNAAWFEGYEGSGTSASIQITEGILQMATGPGMSETGVNHNFIGQDILNTGGFSVSVRILNINTEATDTANRYAGFGVGLNASQASGGNDIGGTSPAPIRGNAGSGTADCFVEIDLDGNVKLWLDGTIAATVPVGKTTGTLTAAFECSSFAAGAGVSVSIYLDGKQIDLDSGTSAMDRSFVWDESNANYIALSARASNWAWLDNFAVRELPISAALSVEYAMAAGLTGSLTDPSANPDGDRLDNFGEWAFGTDPDKPDDTLAATSLVLVQPTSGVFQFAHRRLVDFEAAGANYHYEISSDLAEWNDAMVEETATRPLASSLGYEVVTQSLSPEQLSGETKLFVKITAHP